jgi:outer membrane lipoprotein-sorting protein
VEGRSKPLHIATRKKKGSIVGTVMEDTKPLFTFSLNGNKPPVIVISNDEVVVMYDKDT